MHILFVSRAKAGTGISPIVQKQGESLEGFAMLSYLAITGKGIGGYFKGIMKIRAFAVKNDIDLIHAHYSLSGITAALSLSRPVVCSLMGSDIQSGPLIRFLIRFFARFCWKATIVKSERMKQKTGLMHARVLPNGVDMEMFKPIPQEEARKALDLKKDKKYALFLADPARPEKNYALAEAACRIAGRSYPLELLALKDIPHEKIPLFLSAADVLLLTSYFEGSPNAVKEAMACNCPVVSTDVGDVKDVVAGTEGCYITSFVAKDVAEKIKRAIAPGKRTNGREKIAWLDEKIIAQRLVEVYESIRE